MATMDQTGSGAGQLRSGGGGPGSTASSAAALSTSHANNEQQQQQQPRATTTMSGLANPYSTLIASGYKPLNVKDALSYLDQVGKK